jgi:hypothetical protein
MKDEVHVMFDLETLATRPWAVVLSIGAVAWRPLTGERVDTFYKNIEPQSCIDVGLVADPETAKWWMAPERRSARQALSEDKRPIKEVVDSFASWFFSCGARAVWAHGASFDVPIWETAAKFAGGDVPWNFRSVRDTRTVFDLVDVDFTALKKEGDYHNALDDALNQSRAVTDALRKLGIGK